MTRGNHGRYRIVLIGLIAAAWVVSVFAQDTPASTATANNQTAMIVTSVIGFLTLLVTQLVSMWKQSQETKAAEQRRQWDIEDREIARQRMQKNAEVQLEETAQVAVSLAKQTEAKHAQLTKEILKNTEITKQVGEKADKAYHVANNFAERMEALRRELKSKSEQIEHIDEVSTDTNVKVTDIKEGK